MNVAVSNTTFKNKSLDLKMFKLTSDQCTYKIKTLQLTLMYIINKKP